MAYSQRANALSLDQWAELMGINPIVFHGATVSCSNAIAPPNCNTYWRQYPWQSAATVSREALAQAIESAEAAIEQYIGYNISPTWEKEVVALTHKESLTLQRFGRVEIPLTATHVISAGREERQLVHGNNYPEFDALSVDPRREFGSNGLLINGIAQNALLTISYSDQDSDSFDETATVIIPGVSAGTECEYEVFIPGFMGRGGYEIIPRSRSYNSSTSELTLTFWTWQMIDPAVAGSIARYAPTVAGKIAPIDLCDAANIIDEVEVWRSTTPADYPHAVISMRKSPCTCADGCPHCTVVDYPACVLVRDAESGYITVVRADLEQDPDTLEWSYECCGGGVAPWDCHTPSQSDIPFKITVYYRSGCTKPNIVCDDMCFSEEVAILAAARLSKEVCECGCDVERLANYRRDWAIATQAFSPRITIDDLRNPFGTREGEILVYRRLRHLAGRISLGGIIK